MTGEYWLPAVLTAQPAVRRSLWLIIVAITFASVTRQSSALHCLQCSHALNGVDLPDNKYQLRLTAALPEPKCDKHVEVQCEGGRDVCVAKATQVDVGEFWLLKGCDFSTDYDQLGCNTMPTYKSKTTVTRTVHQSHVELQVCVCATNNCNSGTSVNIRPTIIVTLVVLIRFTLCGCLE